ncbi:unnamed protein product [Phytomonas sp. EM1]|nr:unnamed protein product [Phytomonas sp. EM1]|eukprot:CCW65409.1 unnamed protein product [Phytomonas sp. isolate EM1]
MEHVHEMERLQCQLVETESRLASVEGERLGFMKELEALHQEQLIAKEHKQNDDFLEQLSGQEKIGDTAVAAAPCTDQSTMLDLQRLVDISALMSSEREERLLIELDEQRGVNAFYVLFVDLQASLEVAQQVALDAESHVDALTKQLWERERECQSDAAVPVSGEVRNFDGTPPGSSVGLMTSTMVLDLSQLQAQVKSLEEKATSLQALLDDIEGAPVGAQVGSGECASHDVCAPIVDDAEKYDHDDPSILHKELLRAIQCLTSLGLQIDLLHDRLQRNSALTDAQAKLPCEVCTVGELQDQLPLLSPSAEAGHVELPPRLPPISVQWLELDPVVLGEDSNADGDVAMATYLTPPLPSSWWNLDEVVAALTQPSRPDEEPSQLEASGDPLYRVGLNLAQALGLAPPGTPSFALWDRFLLQLQNVYRVQQQTSPLYCSDKQAANASRLFGALVLQSGVLERTGTTFGEKWVAAVAGLSQLLGRPVNYEGEANLRDESLCRWGFVKQLIQHVESSICHSQNLHEGTLMSFVPHSEGHDPIAMVHHLLCGESVEFQQAFMISCGAQLKDAEANGLSTVDFISVVSLLELFLMLSQEVSFFDHTTAMESSLVACERTLMGNDESQTVVSSARRLLSHLDGRVLPLLLLVSRILSQSSSYCLVQALLTTRNRLLDQLLDEEKEFYSSPSIGYFTANSMVMETFVDHILSAEAPIPKNTMPLSMVANEVSEQEILQLYKDNVVYREHLEALLCSIENKKNGSPGNGLA